LSALFILSLDVAGGSLAGT